MKRLMLRSLIATAVVSAVIAGAWVSKMDGDCRRLLATSSQSDVEVRRTSAGICYPCRSDGPLYDISYRPCEGGDRAYRAS